MHAQAIPPGLRVAAWFYLGRIESISGHISEGLSLLTRAYMGCQNDRTMQSILRYLVPVRGAACCVGCCRQHT
jgi:hypothetical protein